MPKVDFYADNSVYLVSVTYISDFPRGKDGSCAFCFGDPCSEYPGIAPKGSQIKKYHQDYYNKHNQLPDTCPMCKGQPT